MLQSGALDYLNNTSCTMMFSALLHAICFGSNAVTHCNYTAVKKCHCIFMKKCNCTSVKKCNCKNCALVLAFKRILVACRM